MILEENYKLKQKLSTSNTLKLDLIQNELNFIDNRFDSIEDRYISVNEDYENYLKIIQQKCDLILNEFEINKNKLTKNIESNNLFEFEHIKNNGSLIEKMEEIGKRTNMLAEIVSKNTFHDQIYGYESRVKSPNLYFLYPNLSLFDSNESEHKNISFKTM
jgi:hypothetical protein